MPDPIQRISAFARRRRWRLAAVVVLVASAAAYVSLCCIPPASFRATKEPREGRAMNSRVAVVYSQKYQIDLGGAEKLHSFDIRKYAKIFLALNTDGYVRPEDVFVPEPVSRTDLLRVHTPQYLESLRDPAAVARYLEAPIVAAMPAPLLDAGVLLPFRYATGGTILASRLALQYGIAINVGGGYHHAKPDRNYESRVPPVPLRYGIVVPIRNGLIHWGSPTSVNRKETRHEDSRTGRWKMQDRQLPSGHRHGRGGV